MTDAHAAAARAQLNVLVTERLLDELATAVHLSSIQEGGPHDQSSVVTSALRRELDRLAAAYNAGAPWDVETGARLRAARRRRRT